MKNTRQYIYTSAGEGCHDPWRAFATGIDDDDLNNSGDVITDDDKGANGLEGHAYEATVCYLT